MNTEYYTSKLLELSDTLADLEALKALTVGQERAPLTGAKSLDYKIKVCERRIENIYKKLDRQKRAVEKWREEAKYKQELLENCEKHISELIQKERDSSVTLSMHPERIDLVATIVNIGKELIEERKTLTYLKRTIFEHNRRKPSNEAQVDFIPANVSVQVPHRVLELPDEFKQNKKAPIDTDVCIDLLREDHGIEVKPHVDTGISTEVFDSNDLKSSS